MAVRWSESVCQEPVSRPGQIFISSGAAGLGGDDFVVPGPKWWVLDVPRVTLNP